MGVSCGRGKEDEDLMFKNISLIPQHFDLTLFIST